MDRLAETVEGAPHEVEAALREREALLRAIVETTPVALIGIDAGGVIQIFNPAAERLFLYRAAEVVGKNVALLMPSPYRERHDEHIRRYLTTGERRIIGIGRTVVGLRKDGTTFPMDLSVGEARAGDRRLFTGFVRDLTERQTTQRRVHELQAELLHVSRLTAMGEMASALAHELNQPLTAIMNYVQAGRRMLAKPEPARVARVQELLDKAVSQAERGGQIIHRLRRFVTAGETERTPEPINEVIEEASGLALVGAADKGITVRLELAADLPPVLLDKVQIHQVVINLIRNSIDALAEVERREVRIACKRAGPEEVEITVADTGPGLAESVARRLFEPFVTTKRDGMGIGLSICRRIVDAHGGRLWASASADGGTAFHFTLPVA